ncbi:hypothetical protein [Prevotella sp. OH937_COT-195]|uniref:hypothetical protein n=1 Tax=Prevotella sp. OH937_COT-195 TaxID=2491051 RepID=UPI000F64D4B2|nr:hypothetical protein [Prevotella sp. OH937_COT-195]RRC98146.1 hypothetical protein EII32_09500 [Prevotella sp. OH937_COT-195]
MKHYKLLSLAAAALLALAGCSNDETAQDTARQGEEDLTGLTEFAMVEEEIKNEGMPGEAAVPASTPQTRTAGFYTGSQLDFYWKEGDELWLLDPTATPNLIKSYRSSIKALMTQSGDNKVPRASFWFKGHYNKSEYVVRYTGKGNTVGDRVTIRINQETTKFPNNHNLGINGDCASAIARYDATQKRYLFTLTHRASYLTFTPHSTHNFANTVKVTKIRVKANKPIAGVYDFSTNKIADNATPLSSSSTAITLTPTSGGVVGCPLPGSTDWQKNACTMVIAPGTYSWIEVEYTVYDSATKTEGKFAKRYNNVTLKPGRNRRIDPDIRFETHDQYDYWMWDANYTAHYWKAATPPVLNGESASGYPPYSVSTSGAPLSGLSNSQNYPVQAVLSGSGPDTHTTIYTGGGCRLLSVNQLLWLVQKGNPHVEKDRPWTMPGTGHLYKGGMWFYKKANISGFRKDKSPDGSDYRYGGDVNYTYTNLKTGEPKPNNGKYFFLPFTGYFRDGKLNNRGIAGYFWSQSSAPDAGGRQRAYSLRLYENKIQVTGTWRTDGCHYMLNEQNGIMD